MAVEEHCIPFVKCPDGSLSLPVKPLHKTDIAIDDFKEIPAEGRVRQCQLQHSSVGHLKFSALEWICLYTQVPRRFTYC